MRVRPAKGSHQMSNDNDQVKVGFHSPNTWYLLIIVCLSITQESSLFFKIIYSIEIFMAFREAT